MDAQLQSPGRIRVLMTVDAVGGVWTYALDLARELASLGVEVVLVVLGPEPDTGQRAAASAMAGLTLLTPGLALDWLADKATTRETAAALASLAAEQGVDLVHLNSPCLAADQPYPVPVLTVDHGSLACWWEIARRGQDLPADLAWHAALTGRGLRACARVLAPSASHAAAVRRVYALAVTPQIVRNGRALPLQTGCKSAPASARFAFTAGRLWDDVKDAPTLDRVAGRLPYPLRAAGPTTAPHGSPVAFKHMEILGNIAGAELAGYLAQRPVFVSAARFEPFGLAVLEAAQAGCPLVLADIPTFRELWDGAARFVAVGDDERYAAEVIEIMSDHTLRDQLGSAAQNCAATYTASRMAAATATHYRALLEARIAA
ncbi:MAG: glycosyltransferase family 4 protein [Pseudomonadota bacterium]